MSSLLIASASGALPGATPGAEPLAEAASYYADAAFASPGDLARQVAKLEVATDLAGITDPFAAAHSVSALGVRSVPLAGPNGASVFAPSEAAAALAAAHGIGLDDQTAANVATWDTLPARQAGALAGVFVAYLAFEEAATEAYAAADADALASLSAFARLPVEERGPVADWPSDDALGRAGLDLAPVVAARGGLLDAVAEFQVAFEGFTVATGAPVAVAPVFAVDLAGTDDVYEDDVALLLDVGGDDVYHNNAGGSQVYLSDCMIGEGVRAAAAVVDLAGNDDYTSGRMCGVNGGGYHGAGFLFDGAGDDHYMAPMRGVNGGGFVGSGFLLDVSGNDVYQSMGCGVNGGVAIGLGVLIDGAGHDVYETLELGTNGAGDVDGQGALVDLQGNDWYGGQRLGTNGGAFAGHGFLFDGGGGDDRYVAAFGAVNGGTWHGTGLLVDDGGADVYLSGDAPDVCIPRTEIVGTCGANGGAFEGIGGLIDLGGDDGYFGGHRAVNGGGALGAGLLIDVGGTDVYSDDDVDCTDCSMVPKGAGGAQLDV